jgi:hypothetical protein
VVVLLLCVQILQRTPDLKPGDIKAMQLHKDGYHMKVRAVADGGHSC